MKVKYQDNLGETELDVISIKPTYRNGMSYHVLISSDGREYDATYFSYSSGCVFKASVPDNW